MRIPEHAYSRPPSEAEDIDAYAEYIRLIESLDESEAMAPVPDRVVDGVAAAPLFALIGSESGSPLFQGVCILTAPSEDLPHLIIRIDLSANAPMYQMPIGLIAPGLGDAERNELLDGVLGTFLVQNGMGKRPTSRPFLRVWPDAVMICSPASAARDAIPHGLATAAGVSGLSFAEPPWTGPPWCPPPPRYAGWVIWRLPEPYLAWWERVTLPDRVDTAMIDLLRALWCPSDPTHGPTGLAHRSRETRWIVIFALESPTPGLLNTLHAGLVAQN